MATNNRGNIIPPRNDNKGNIVPHTISKQNTIFTGEGIIPEILGDNYLVSDDLVCTLPMTSGPNGTGIEDLVTARASDSGSYLDNITTGLLLKEIYYGR